LTILAASIGVGQFLTHANELQWIFAFVIMAILFLATLVIAIPGMFGREFTFRRESYNLPADQERAPLLDDN
jgi:membrane protein YdbS with pleckstrin-like domain